MLKATLKAKENTNIEKFGAVIPYLKKLNVGYCTKKSNVLTREQIETFLKQAEDGEYLFMKVNNYNFTILIYIVCVCIGCVDLRNCWSLQKSGIVCFEI
jgi:hypothetical protein